MQSEGTVIRASLSYLCNFLEGIMVLVSFFVALVKHLDKSNFREQGCIQIHSPGAEAIMAGASRQQELEAALPITPIIRKQRAE